MGPRSSESDKARPDATDLGLAPLVIPPDASGRENFIREAELRFGDNGRFAGERWDSLPGMISRGDLDGLPDSWSDAPSPAVSRTRAAWLLTPREVFIPANHRSQAYQPVALSLNDGQTISAPYMVTRMTAALNPSPEHHVLEVGTGSGYQAALLAVMTPWVHTIEYVGNLASRADSLLSGLTPRRPWIGSIQRKAGDGYSGWEEGAPYHRILITCAIDHIPPALIEQLAPGGFMILPLGPRNVQRLLAVRKNPERSELEVLDVYGDGTRVVFVPFIHQ